MTTEDRDSYLRDVIADDLKAQLKEMLPTLEDFPESLAGDDSNGEDNSEKSARLALEKGVPTPLQFVANAIQKRVQGVLTMNTVEEYDNLIDHVARAAFGRFVCPTGHGWITEDLGWTQKGISCYPCDRITEVGLEAIAQERFDRLMQNPERLASIAGQARATSASRILSMERYLPEDIRHVAALRVPFQFVTLMNEYNGDNGRFVRVRDSETKIGPGGVPVRFPDHDPTFYWEPKPAEQESTG